MNKKNVVRISETESLKNKKQNAGIQSKNC